MTSDASVLPETVIRRAEELRRGLTGNFRDEAVTSIYGEAERIFRRVVHQPRDRHRDLDQKIDRLVTSPIFGLPLMLVILAMVFWLTITGANVPSAMLATGLFWFEDQAAALFDALGSPWWLTGFIWHGVFKGLAWVVSVMLPPMAIFFPLFTILEDLGYLPRIAFNLDFLFRRAGAHGKQALTMAMGFGCNAAGIIATRVIDSPRERLVAILTNNFVPCNGRFPTLIMLATIFVAAAFPPVFASFAAAGAVLGVVLIGVGFTLLMSWVLSRTVLKGEASAFTLELPPYRRPGVARILYTSLIDRTLFVLWRAMLTAAPAGAAIWLLGNIYVNGTSVAIHVGQLAAAARPRHRPRRRHPPRLHHRHPGQRDRGADDADGLHGHRDDDRARLDERSADAARRSQRLDDADRGQPDAVLAAAQPVRDDDPDDLQGNAEPQVGDGRRADAAGTRLPRDVPDGVGGAAARVGLNEGLERSKFELRTFFKRCRRRRSSASPRPAP